MKMIETIRTQGASCAVLLLTVLCLIDEWAGILKGILRVRDGCYRSSSYHCLLLEYEIRRIRRFRHRRQTFLNNALFPKPGSLMPAGHILPGHILLGMKCGAK